MKLNLNKRVVAAASCVAMIAIALLVVGRSNQVDANDVRVVTVRVLRAKLMKKPRFIGSAVTNLSRGARLKVIATKGQWFQVESKRGGGWIHKGQIVGKDVKLSSKPGSSGSNASREEVELAGRGFTPEVEREYKQRNPRLDFSHVDAIENTSVDSAELESFIRDGELAGGQS